MFSDANSNSLPLRCGRCLFPTTAIPHCRVCADGQAEQLEGFFTEANANVAGFVAQAQSRTAAIAQVLAFSFACLRFVCFFSFSFSSSFTLFSQAFVFITRDVLESTCIYHSAESSANRSRKRQCYSSASSMSVLDGVSRRTHLVAVFLSVEGR